MGDEKRLRLLRKQRGTWVLLCKYGKFVQSEKYYLGGGVSEAGDLLLHPVNSTFAKHVFPASAGSTEITLRGLGMMLESLVQHGWLIAEGTRALLEIASWSRK